jgi:hypothetical protein
MTENWPPLITDAARPRWMIRRDRILTFLVWVLFLVLFIKQGLAFRARLDAYLSTPGAEWDFMLAPFLIAVAIMLGWLVLTAILTYGRAMRARRTAQPLPLPLQIEAEHFGVTPDALEAARQTQVIAMAIDAGGSFRFEAPTCTAPAGDRGPPVPRSPDPSTPGR